MLNHLKFKWQGQDQLFPSPFSFSSTDFISSLLLVEIMGTISGTTSPDSILSANRPCNDAMYRIASRITSSCETLSLTQTDGTSSFSLSSSISASSGEPH